ncbi:hypothetical protein JTE90_004831 [Oedothorax gibbosus]|uniref:Nuclear receptor domain-containing protein n=1 Tax=Oedothorax gibbosus TaxID=931172 RepID=A0AAV6UQC6_9ARAC|nr:hypothetical protein JTE90_004831 [Oedothorax gibbosus]
MMNQLCKVCGEPAAGYHFGAFTCEGCKSFFGRTYNNLAALGECKNSGQCVINKKNRTSCKSCRLKKCLLVGMSKSGSRYGRRSNWFKIHCLIQDQAEMSSRLGEQGVLANSHYDSNKELVHHFRPDFSEGPSNRGSPSSDPLESTSYGYFPSASSYSNGYEAGSSPTYETRKENFHHLPLSPVSPLHPAKFFFHSAAFSKFPKEMKFPVGPVQENPIDLSVRKPETPTSDATVDEDEYINMDDEPQRAETPLDLTAKRVLSC